MANDALLPSLEKGASEGEKSGATRSVIPTVAEGSPGTIGILAALNMTNVERSQGTQGISRCARNDLLWKIPGRRIFTAPDLKPVRRRRQ